MGKGNYYGVNAILSKSGHGFSYDPSESRNTPLPKQNNKKSESEKPKPPSASKTKKQIHIESVRLKELALKRYATSCAFADKYRRSRPQRPTEIRKHWLKHDRQKRKFEEEVQAILNRIQT